MHVQAIHFLQYVSRNFPEFFTNKTVLDVGSGDINGNNRSLFDAGCSYTGNDVFEAPNVSVVCKTSALTFEDSHFDMVISSECFEHDPEYELSFKNIMRMLKPGGLFAFTCASTGRAEHGTRRTSPNDSFGTIGKLEQWQDYYKNLTIHDVAAALDLQKDFSQYKSYFNNDTKDLYFWGIKASPDPKKYDVEPYVAYRTIETS